MDREPDLEIDMATLKRSSTRGAVMTLGSQGAKFAISFGSQLALARLLTPAEFGLVAMAAPVMLFVGIFTDLGLSQATIQRAQINQRELTSLFWVNVAASLVLATVLILASPLVGWVYGEPKVGPIVAVFAGMLVFGGLTAQSSAILTRRMQFKTMATIDIVVAVAAASAGIVSALLGAGYWALVIQQGVNSLTTLIMVWSLSEWRPSRPQFDPAIKSMLRFGSHLTGFSIISYISSYLDNLLVGLLKGPVALGLFDRAFKLVVQPLWQVEAPVSRVTIPMLSRLSGNDSAYREAYTRMLQLLLLVTTPGLACVSVLSQITVLGLLGPQWLGTAPILTWLSIAAMFAPFTGSAFWMFVSQDRTKDQLNTSFFSTGLIILSLLLGIHWGPVGIAAAYALFAPLVHGVYVWVATRTGPVKRRDVARASYPIVLAVMAAMLVLIGARPYLTFAPLPALIAGALISYSTVIPVLLAFPDGNRMLRSMWELRSMLSKSR